MIRHILASALAALGVAAPALATDIGYEIEGAAFEGYFAAAEDARGLVILIHDWDGLDDYERTRADMLAALGYDTFAVDLFGAGNRPETNEARAAATRAVLGDPARLEALMLGALAEARTLSEATSAVVMGYCFGGTVALALARTGAAEDVTGYASFHGNFPDGPDWPEATPPLLILHGGADQNPSITDLAAFVEEAELAGLSYEIEIYSGAPHAFTVFGSDRYRERADALSWDAFQRFLGERLDGAAG